MKKSLNFFQFICLCQLRVHPWQRLKCLTYRVTEKKTAKKIIFQNHALPYKM